MEKKPPYAPGKQACRALSASSSKARASSALLDRVLGLCFDIQKWDMWDLCPCQPAALAKTVPWILVAHFSYCRVYGAPGEVDAAAAAQSALAVRGMPLSLLVGGGAPPTDALALSWSTLRSWRCCAAPPTSSESQSEVPSLPGSESLVAVAAVPGPSFLHLRSPLYETADVWKPSFPGFGWHPEA
eukprot:CAMPEP_0181463094 /NCGR_PEP_ID=MMETSP1110-20121109/34738_1 /TAXON_ID=174948 /ORGANISM="Symbiodinium sp., Strain CCMP421" /LENGTH=185 /DNA_ID=CAMNT_0023587783 /DNA_START=35 /DNA_END=592 /DNA_ORIENTATION=-